MEINNLYHRICNTLGVSEDNRGVNSALFQTHGSDPVIINQVNAATADPEVDLVVLIGGINDYHYAELNYNNYKAAVKQTANAIINKFPNANMIMAFDAGKQATDAKLLRYALAMSEIAGELTIANPGKRFAVPFTVDLASNTNLFASTNHWNAQGTLIVCSRAISELLGGSQYQTLTYRQSIAPESQFTNAGQAYVTKQYDKNSYSVLQEVEILIPYTIRYSGGDTINTGRPLYKLPIGYTRGQSDGYRRLVPGIGMNSDFKASVIPFNLIQDDWSGVTNPAVCNLNFYYDTPVSAMTAQRTVVHIVVPLNPST